MLPIPSLQFFPKPFQDNPTPGMLALSSKIDSLLSSWGDEILEMASFKNPDQCPSDFVSLLGELLSSGIRALDSDRVRRIKVKNSIKGHKNRSLWEVDIKIRIDAISGFSASLASQNNIDDMIWLGDGVNEVEEWWSWGQGSADPFGAAWTGYMVIGYAGYIPIDVGTNTLTNAVILAIVDEIKNDCPAYYIVALGYVIAGVFYEYANGVIS